MSLRSLLLAAFLTSPAWLIYGPPLVDTDPVAGVGLCLGGAVICLLLAQVWTEHPPDSTARLARAVVRSPLARGLVTLFGALAVPVVYWTGAVWAMTLLAVVGWSLAFELIALARALTPDQ